MRHIEIKLNIKRAHPIFITQATQEHSYFLSLRCGVPSGFSGL